MTRPTRIQRAFWSWRLLPPARGSSRRNILFYYDTSDLFDALVIIGVDMVSLGWHNDQATSDGAFNQWVESVTHLVRVNLYRDHDITFQKS